MSSLTDEQIVARVLAGENYLYGVLMDRYTERLFRYARKFLNDQDSIEENVQDVFTKAYESLASFDQNRKFQPWIYRIAHNTFVNVLRAKSRSWIILEWDTLVSLPAGDDPEEAERDRKEMQEIIEGGLEQLSPKYREILTLYYLDEMSYKDISEVLHVPVNTVGVRIRRAKEALKKNIAYER